MLYIHSVIVYVSIVLDVAEEVQEVFELSLQEVHLSIIVEGSITVQSLRRFQLVEALFLKSVLRYLIDATLEDCALDAWLVKDETEDICQNFLRVGCRVFVPNEVDRDVGSQLLDDVVVIVAE